MESVHGQITPPNSNCPSKSKEKEQIKLKKVNFERIKITVRHFFVVTFHLFRIIDLVVIMLCKFCCKMIIKKKIIVIIIKFISRLDKENTFRNVKFSKKKSFVQPFAS